jgi:hypothetical protein
MNGNIHVPELNFISGGTTIGFPNSPVGTQTGISNVNYNSTLRNFTIINKGLYNIKVRLTIIPAISVTPIYNSIKLKLNNVTNSDSLFPVLSYTVDITSTITPSLDVIFNCASSNTAISLKAELMINNSCLINISTDCIFSIQYIGPNY